MATSKPVVFSSITRLKFQAIRARVRAQATAVTTLGDTGTASGSGVSFTWSYSEEAQSLTVTCTKRPWYVSEDLVYDKIRSAMATI